MIELKAPASWSELSLDQFRKIVETLLLQLNREEQLFVLMCELTGIRRYDATDKFMGPDGSDFRLQQHEIVDFCDRFAWIIDSEPDSLPNPTKVDGFLRDMSFGDWFELTRSSASTTTIATSLTSTSSCRNSVFRMSLARCRKSWPPC